MMIRAARLTLFRPYRGDLLKSDTVLQKATLGCLLAPS